MRIGCVGQRHLTLPQFNALANIGQFLVNRKHVLVTGNAEGSDRAFQNGAMARPNQVEVCLPWPSFYIDFIDPANIIHASPSAEDFMNAEVVWKNKREGKFGYVHWQDLSQTTKAFMARNWRIADISEELIAAPSFNEYGAPKGGTGFTILCAEHIAQQREGYRIQIIDLRKSDPIWDICPRCQLGRTLWDCGHPYHRLAAYA